MRKQINNLQDKWCIAKTNVILQKMFYGHVCRIKINNNRKPEQTHLQTEKQSPRCNYRKYCNDV